MIIEFKGKYGNDKLLINTDTVAYVERLYSGKECRINFIDGTAIGIGESYAQAKYKVLHNKPCPCAHAIDSDDKFEFETIEDCREWIVSNKNKYVIKVLPGYYCTYWLPKDGQKPHVIMP